MEMDGGHGAQSGGPPVGSPDTEKPSEWFLFHVHYASAEPVVPQVTELRVKGEKKGKGVKLILRLGSQECSLGCVLRMSLVGETVTFSCQLDRAWNLLGQSE